MRNERRQSVENAPYGLAEEALLPPALPAAHPYYAMRHRLARGHPGGASSTTCSDFFSSYYAPNNATLAIVGDIDIAKTKALVEKYFGTIAQGPAVPPITVDDAADHRRAPRRR